MKTGTQTGQPGLQVGEVRRRHHQRVQALGDQSTHFLVYRDPEPLRQGSPRPG